MQSRYVASHKKIGAFTRLMTTKSETEALLNFALRLSEAAGAAILPHFRQSALVENKRSGDWDPVTEGDKAAERAIRQLIEQTHPTHGIIGEEYGEKKGTSPYTWILDPIDGTRAFVIGLPTWATLIGLYRDGKPLLGLMHQPFNDELFYGGPDGAFLKNKLGIQQIHCATPKPLGLARAGTTSPHHYKNPEQFENLRTAVQLMRYGGDAYFFSLVAAGHLDLALDAGLQIYDIAALIPIIRGAGGIVETWDGTDECMGGNILAASCQALFDETARMLNGAP